MVYKRNPFGEIEINRRGEQLFEEEIAELMEFVSDAPGSAAEIVVDHLRRASTVVVVRVLWGGSDTNQPLEMLVPLWNWLFANRAGLLQVDGEGFYDNTGLVLEID